MFSPRLGIAMLCGALTGALVVTIASPPQPRLLWNVSASAPIGFWYVEPSAALRRGDMVAARLVQPWLNFAARRRYLPANVPLLKRIAAEPGDHICASRGMVFVNGHALGVRRHFDGAGRPMPRWRGCKQLGPRDYFLVMDAPFSFDGRYFGSTLRRDIIGKATPLWLR